MAASEQPLTCRLQSALGRVETCPGAACAFWDRDTRLGGHCAIDELDLAGRPDLAEWLLRLRTQFDAAETHDEEDEAREELYRLLATDDADGG